MNSPAVQDWSNRMRGEGVRAGGFSYAGAAPQPPIQYGNPGGGALMAPPQGAPAGPSMADLSQQNSILQSLGQGRKVSMGAGPAIGSVINAPPPDGGGVIGSPDQISSSGRDQPPPFSGPQPPTYGAPPQGAQGGDDSMYPSRQTMQFGGGGDTPLGSPPSQGGWIGDASRRNAPYGGGQGPGRGGSGRPPGYGGGGYSPPGGGFGVLPGRFGGGRAGGK